jgi:hypothetical protein
MDEKMLEHFRNLDIGAVELSGAQIKKFIDEWFNRIVPRDMHERAADLCFLKDDKMGYLWHVFSYEMVDCIQSDEARRAYDKTERKEAILWSWDARAFFIKDASGLNSVILDDMIDVIITSHDFQWTYAKTHEGYCGPYFYRI